MKKKIALLLALVLTLSIAGCGGTPAETTLPPETTVLEATIPETTVPETTIPETTAPVSLTDGMVNLTELLKDTPIQIEVEGDQIKLSEDGLVMELAADFQYVVRKGKIVAPMKMPPMILDGSVYIDEWFYNAMMCRDGEDQPSLFYGAYFFPQEVLDALDDPEGSEFNKKVLAEAVAPSSMGIELPNIQQGRIFDPQPISNLPSILSEELTKMGYDNPEDYAYTEYDIINGSRTLAQMGLRELIRLHPELHLNAAKTSYIEFQLMERAILNQEALDRMTDEERAFLEEKDICMEDVRTLNKEFHYCYMDQSDEALRELLIKYYEWNLDYVENRASYE